MKALPDKLENYKANAVAEGDPDAAILREPETYDLRVRELLFLVYEPITCRFFPTFYAAKSRQALLSQFREMNSEAISIQIAVMLGELVIVDDPTKATNAVVCAFSDSLIADIDAAAGDGTDYTAEMDRKSEELAEKARQRRHAGEHATATEVTV